MENLIIFISQTESNRVLSWVLLKMLNNAPSVEWFVEEYNTKVWTLWQHKRLIEFLSPYLPCVFYWSLSFVKKNNRNHCYWRKKKYFTPSGAYLNFTTDFFFLTFQKNRYMYMFYYFFYFLSSHKTTHIFHF